jgi:hypothetical protein
MYDIQHCFICRPNDSTVSEDAGIEPRTDASKVRSAYLLAVRRSTTRLDLMIDEVKDCGFSMKEVVFLMGFTTSSVLLL